ncbi:hypothetical protein ACFVY1_25645 [Streptomyces sp. NPDC058293]|uniref:Tc toxin subunit A-related protein n=1 Tax=Streptomyces sp. NPDC058293 TaxID=3346429 RepID=UPI0036E5E3A4
MTSIRAGAAQFHETVAASVTAQYLGDWVNKQDIEFSYSFENFFHPFVGELIDQLNRKSLAGLLDPKFHQSLKTEFFDTFYTELTSDLVKIKHQPKEIDLSEGGPYADYNWELLFHVPLTIAVHLSKNQRFAEARRWFHYIFDPTSNDTSLPVPQRFWRFLAFRNAGAVKQIDEQLMILSKPANECTQAELDLKKKILQGYEAIKNRPFQPHAVARTRQLAYQYCVVMKYLDNLIAWGDSLFRQDTVESINEATQLYVLAANLLGQRPQRIPEAGNVRPKTFAELKKQGLDAMGNTLIELEGKFPLSLGMPKVQGDNPNAAAPLFGIGRALYFCIPRNDKLLSYWETVADRLFKIRNCMNIEGVVRQLALFDPPLDPGMLVKAAAAGIDIGATIGGMNQPISPVRAPLLIEKALELCGEVRGLGAALLAAIEKGDSEQLALLRQGHEIQIQQMQHEVRFLQWASAQEATKSLLTNRKSALERLHYYQRLLGLPTDPNAPDDLSLSFEGLELNEENFAEAYGALVGQYDKQLTTQQLPKLKITGDTSPTQQSGGAGQGTLYLNTNEDVELNDLLPSAKRNQAIAFTGRQIAPIFSLLPDFPINFHFWGIGGTIILGGTSLTKNVQTGADVLDLMAARDNHDASSAAKTALHQRRADEWLLQYNLAAHELMQIGRQILTSLITEQIAHHDYLTVKQQITDAQEVDRFLREKFTNEELYAWMQGEISRLYYEYYRFAFDTARKAEQAMKREVMRPELDAQDFVKFNYWDGGRKGLLSGEALYLDVKRMELAYHESNKREYELTRHVSLRQLAPAALLALKTTGACQVTIPEWVFDLDTPGHYMRRIKSVGITIPCVTGPYTGLSCTLTLTKSSLRTSPLVTTDGYVRYKDAVDDRFVDYFSATQSIVTSSGQNDSGLFEANLRADHLLPFEGAGVESVWNLELPKEFRQFDYGTISDAILHFRYTAREGGEQLRTAAVTNLQTMAADSNATGLGLLFSLRRDFPGEWSKFVNGTDDFTTVLRKDHFPYLAQDKKIGIAGFELYRLTGTSTPEHRSVGNKTMWDAATTALNDSGSCTFQPAVDVPGTTQVLTRSADADVWLIVRYVLG